MCVLFWVSCKANNLWVLSMRRAVLFIFRFSLLLYSAGSGVNIVQVVLSRFSAR